jgi:hypothetical protein
VPPDAGLVVADFYRAKPGGLDDLVELFERRVRPVLLEQGHGVLGHFVAELAPNDYPRLPAVQDPTLLLVLSAYRDSGHCADLRAAWRDSRPWGLVLEGASRPQSADGVTTLQLRPTARSLIRYRDGGPR